MGIQFKENEIFSIEDGEKYNRDGFLHLKNVLSEEHVNKLRKAVSNQISQRNSSRTSYDFDSIAKQIWAGVEEVSVGNADRFEIAYYKAMIDQDDEARPILDKTNNGHDENGLFFYDAAGWRTEQGIRDVALDSILPNLCVDLLGTTYLNFWEDTTFVKAPNTEQRTAFHQDYAYFQITGSKCCIIWIPLDSATKENGAMQYIRGSHLWGETFAPNLFICQTPMLDAQDPKLPDIESNPDAFDIVTVEAEPGDIIIHDVMTVHGSGGNKSKDQMRRAMSFRYCGDDIRYYDRAGAIPQPHISTSLNDGDPLFSKDYPLVWPRPYPSAKIAQLFTDMPVDEEG